MVSSSHKDTWKLFRLSKYRLSRLAGCALLLALSTVSICRAEPEAADQSPVSELTGLSMEALMQIPVYGASKFEQNASEAPASVSVVTADEIKKFGYRSLADIIRAQRGFFVTSDRAYSYVGARGIGREGGYNNRVMVLVDGHRLNDNAYDAVMVGNEGVLDVELIDRVEIIRGPGSSLYGNNAFLAVFNIYTRHQQGLHGVEVSANAGSLDTYRGRIAYGGDFDNGLGLSLSGSLLDSGGNRTLFYPEFNDPSTNNGIARNLDYERNYRLFGALSLKDFTLEGAYVSRTKGVPTASYQTIFNDSRNYTLDSRGYLDLKYSHTFEGDWGVLARLFYDRYYYYGILPYDASGGAGPVTAVLNRDAATNNWIGSELQVTKTLLEKHRVIVGGEFQDNLTQELENHDIAPYQPYLDVNHTTHRWALFLQDEFTVLPSLLLNAGVRYDRFQTFGGTVSPRLALIWSPLERTVFKGIYGEAFRAPNSYETYYGADVFGQKGNPDLKPEKIRNFELIGEQALGAGMRLTAEGFWSKITDMISQGGDPADGFLVFTNQRGADSKGAALEIEGVWWDELRGRASYSFTDTRDSATGQLLVNSPRHMAKLNLVVPILPERLFTGIELQYLSSRKTLAGNGTGSTFLTNLTLFSKRLVKGMELTGTVRNLFDVKYGDPGGTEHAQDIIVQDGRTFDVKLNYRF